MRLVPANGQGFRASAAERRVRPAQHRGFFMRYDGIGAALCCACAICTGASAGTCHKQTNFAVAVHGGVFSEKNTGEKRLAAMKAALEQARTELRNGAPSL